jgi:hypothetical protein
VEADVRLSSHLDFHCTRTVLLGLSTGDLAQLLFSSGSQQTVTTFCKARRAELLRMQDVKELVRYMFAVVHFTFADRRAAAVACMADPGPGLL